MAYEFPPPPSPPLPRPPLPPDKLTRSSPGNIHGHMTKMGMYGSNQAGSVLMSYVKTHLRLTFSFRRKAQETSL